MQTSIAMRMKERVKDTGMTEEEWRARVDLAAVYRLAYLYGWDDIVYTHITLRVPGKEDHFLINPFGLAFEEITASNLVKIDLNGAVVGESDADVNMGGFTIHSAVHGARHEVNCVMHLHINTGIALSMMKCGLLNLSQHAMLFHNRLGYHDYEGPALDLDERRRLIANLGNKNAMILRNHGLLTAGGTVGEAFVRMSYLERACQTQIQAMSCGTELTVATDELAEKTARTHENDVLPLGEREWPAMLRRLDRELPGYDK
ncbi:Ribulose-5-phosphate 4-epimerase/Fuculose-1-phosphate aldolase [Paraburkholderia steynii]|uniref:Ribulose-5-phosphate 4-epimerase/Fuculose-1-phosphate aldolase n=1 Tax=Paraburkholderia steynii TaxID=1245441 RepID=A0A7Z7BBK4_9BURK|nr:class II aldolase/adducin family protein [Paraburkholderia steynii]SDI56909.1 Ribulose-5-phosphate 4-epimerase/Fuculose-1-phosphate aldolase [Paraburkholderia steynii]